MTVLGTERTAGLAEPAGGSRLRRLRTDPLFATSLALMATTVVTSGLGYVLWLVIARVFGQQVSGEGAAITSLMMAVSLLAAVGAAAAMIQWLPQATDAVAWRRRVTAGVVATTVLSIAGGLLAVVILPLVSGALPILATWPGAALFVAGVLFTSLGTLHDYICVSEQRGALMLLRNGLASLLRVPLVFVPFVVAGQPTQVLLAWTASAGLSLVVAVPLFRGRAPGRTLVRPVPDQLVPELRLMRSSVAGQHLITVTAMLGAYLLPLVVVDRLTAVDNAYFYITWMLGSLYSIISPAVSTALFASAAADPAQIRAATRRSMLIIGGLLAVPMMVYLFGGRLLLGLFGADYAEHGWMLLVLLTIAAIPDAVTNITVAVLRATERIAAAVWLNGLMLLGTLVLSFLLLPRLGIIAVGIGWLVAQSTGAAWSALTLRRLGVVRAQAGPA